MLEAGLIAGGEGPPLTWSEQAGRPRLSALAPATSDERPATTPASSLQLPISSLPLLRPVGQMSNTYVIAEGPDGMYLIDQHAAHERVLYERFLAERREGVRNVQPLLQPAPVELTARQRELLIEFAGELDAAGLAIEPFGEGAYLVRAVPPSLADSDVTRAVGELLDLLAREDAPREEPAHRVAASLACHGAVRAGKPLGDEEQRELLRLLEAAEQPRTCPHGRPTMIHLSSDVLARQFRRR